VKRNVLVHAPLALAALLVSGLAAAAEPVVVERIVNLPAPEVWKLFTTSEGMQSWMAPRADVDFRIGGMMRTREGTDGALGDAQTVVHEILSFEPERMLSVRTRQLRPDSPFRDAVMRTWTVIYFQPLDPGMTNVRIVELGLGDDEESRRLRDLLVHGNGQALDELQKKYRPTCALCKAEGAK
jgi:uncharacterized protein YndB with AHSA1/START domain